LQPLIAKALGKQDGMKHDPEFFGSGFFI
jgi:hypothetical protein